MNAAAPSPLELIGVKYWAGGATPADGFDCWTLVQWVRLQYFGLDTPDVFYYDRFRMRAVRTIEAAKASGEWVQVDAPGPPGAVVGMAQARRRRLHHVGVSLGAAGVLHAWCGMFIRSPGSVILTPWPRLVERFPTVEVYEWRG